MVPQYTNESTGENYYALDMQRQCFTIFLINDFLIFLSWLERDGAASINRPQGKSVLLTR